MTFTTFNLGLAFSLLTGTAFLCACPQSALAQGSVTIKKGSLEKAGWYNAPRQYQIVDAGPKVTDCRSDEPEEAPVNIVIPPRGKHHGGGSGGSIGEGAVRVTSRNLPAANFDSNIPARGMGPSTRLPEVKSGGLSPIDKAPRPLGLNDQKTVHARPLGAQSAPTTAAYAPHGGTAPIYHASGGASDKATADLRGRLLDHK